MPECVCDLTVADICCDDVLKTGGKRYCGLSVSAAHIPHTRMRRGGIAQKVHQGVRWKRPGPTVLASDCCVVIIHHKISSRQRLVLARDASLEVAN
jgi:hypothetical protein